MGRSLVRMLQRGTTGSGLRQHPCRRSEQDGDRCRKAIDEWRCLLLFLFVSLEMVRVRKDNSITFAPTCDATGIGGPRLVA